jgi:CheY-like chemotaxis protein
MRILYVDNDPDDGDIFCRAIEHIDATIECVAISLPDEAMEFFRESCPDFVFLDFKLLPADGFKILRQLRQYQCFGATRVIMYSGFMNNEEIDACKRLGAYDDIKKTEDFQKLVAGLRKTLM